MSDETKDAGAKVDAISTLSSEERAAINAMPYEEAREKLVQAVKKLTIPRQISSHKRRNLC